MAGATGCERIQGVGKLGTLDDGNMDNWEDDDDELNKLYMEFNIPIGEAAHEGASSLLGEVGTENVLMHVAALSAPPRQCADETAAPNLSEPRSERQVALKELWAMHGQEKTDRRMHLEGMRAEFASALKSMKDASEQQLLARERLLCRLIGNEGPVQHKAGKGDSLRVLDSAQSAMPVPSVESSTWDMPSPPQVTNAVVEEEILNGNASLPPMHTGDKSRNSNHQRSDKSVNSIHGRPSEDSSAWKRRHSITRMIDVVDNRATLVWALSEEDRDNWILNQRKHWQKHILTKLVAIVDWWMKLSEPPRTGIASECVQSKHFETLTGLVIIINAITMMFAINYSVQHVDDETPYAFYALELFFLIYYSVELILKIGVHRLYFFCNNEMHWNLFDLTVVVISVVDFMMTNLSAERPGIKLSFMRVLRIARVARILRVVRLLRIFTELRLILNSMLGSFVSLFWSFVMLVFIFYIFGLTFVQGLASYLIDNGNGVSVAQREALLDRFGSVQLCMLTLYKATSGGADWEIFYDNPDGVSMITSLGSFYACLYIFFTFFFQVALLNILTGIFVEQAMKLAQPDRDYVAWERRKQEISDAKAMMRVFEQMDADHSGAISREEFHEYLRSGKLKSYLTALGLDIKDAKTFFNMMASSQEDDDEVNLVEFVQGCTKLRGSATSVDVQSLIWETKRMRKDLMGLQSFCQTHFHEMCKQTG